MSQRIEVRRRTEWGVFVMAVVCVVAPVAAVAGPAGKSAVVLDTAGVWRIHHTLAPPIFIYPDGPKEYRWKQNWLSQPTDPAPATWMRSDFDDRGWLRGTALMKCRTAQLSRASLRGKFIVTDLSAVGKLTLSIDYHGGVIVFLNGKEIARKHLPAGELKADTLAEAYPTEAFITETGSTLGDPGVYLNGRPQKNISEESRRRLKLRGRTLADIVLPGELLVKGVNVLAVQIVRAPYDGPWTRSASGSGCPSATSSPGTPAN